MSLRTDDIEGARPRHFERQKQITRAQQYNNMSNIFQSAVIQPQVVATRNPDIYSQSQVMNQNQQQNQQIQQVYNQVEQQNGQNSGNQGREKSLYQIEYQQISPNILQEKASIQQVNQRPNRNPLYNESTANTGKMMSEKQYQDQLMMKELQRFRDQQAQIEQVKKNREQEYRQYEMMRKQKEDEQILQLQQQQEEKLQIQRLQDEERKIREMQEKEQQQMSIQEEIRLRDEMLKEKQRYLIEQEYQAKQRKSASVNNRPKQQEKLNNPEKFTNDNALIEQINSQANQISEGQKRLPSQSQQNVQGINDRDQQNYPEKIRTPVKLAQDQFMSIDMNQEQSSPPKNAKYFNSPIPTASLQNNDLLYGQVQHIRNQPIKPSQLAAKSILNPMTAILQHNGPMAGQNSSMNPQKQKQTRILAITDSDNKIREQVSKFFGQRNIFDFQLFSLPGSGAGLINDKGWKDTFFSCFSFMRQSYDFSDVFIFCSVSSDMIPLWKEQSNQESGLNDQTAIKNYVTEILKQSVSIVQQNVSEVIKVSGFLFDQRGSAEKIV